MTSPIAPELLDTLGVDSLTNGHPLKKNVALEIVATLVRDKGEQWITDNLDTVRKTITSVTGAL